MEQRRTILVTGEAGLRRGATFANGTQEEVNPDSAPPASSNGSFPSGAPPKGAALRVWLFPGQRYSVLRHFVLYTLASNGLVLVASSLIFGALLLVGRSTVLPYSSLSVARLALLAAVSAAAAAGVMVLAVAVDTDSPLIHRCGGIVLKRLR